MKPDENNIIYTIGHSTRTAEEFIAILKSFGIKTVADIRSYPGSRRFPQFNKENLKFLLKTNGIEYIHMQDLGGRRKVKKDSHNNRWKNDSFRGYADYMESEEFTNAAGELEKIAMQQPVAYMCSEAVWWRCHRSMVSDWLKAKGWKVMHIMSADKAQEHPYTQAARVSGNKVYYFDEDLFSRI